MSSISAFEDAHRNVESTSSATSSHLGDALKIENQPLDNHSSVGNSPASSNNVGGSVNNNNLSEHGDTSGDGRSTDSSSERCNLIVNYLPHEIDDASLMSLFMEHGAVSSAKVVKDKHTKKSLGYGFVKFVQEADAMDALERKNGYMAGNKKLKVSIARPPSDEIRNCKLYVTNLPKEMTEQDVEALFQQFGEIIECRVLRDLRNHEASKGVAFIQFNLKAQANQALSMNGYRPVGSDRFLIVKYAEDQQKKNSTMQRITSPGAGIGPLMGLGNFDRMRGDPSDHRYNYAQSRSAFGEGQSHNPNLSQNSRTTMRSPMHNNQIYSVANMQLSQFAPQSNYHHHNHNHNSIETRGKAGDPMEWFRQVPPHMTYDSNGIHGHGHRHGHGGGQSPISYESIKQIDYSSPGQDHMYMSDRIMQENSNVLLIISNLPPHSDVAMLHELFSPYGHVLSTHVDQISQGSSSNGLCTGRGTVQMAGLSHAQFAAQALSGIILASDCQPLQVSIALGGLPSNAMGGGRDTKIGRGRGREGR